MVLLVLVKTLTRLFSIDWTIDPKTNKVKNPGLFPIDPVRKRKTTEASIHPRAHSSMPKIKKRMKQFFVYVVMSWILMDV